MTTLAIETIQKRLAELNYYFGEPDNAEGPLTYQAVVAFKAAHGLREREYLGPLTLALLFSDDAKPAETVKIQPGSATAAP